MNSATILMNFTTSATPAAPAVDAEAGSSEGFSAALSALQPDGAAPPVAIAQQAESPATAVADAQDVSALAIIASRHMQGSNAAANGAGSSAPTAEAGEGAAPAAAGVDLSPLLSAASATG